LTGANAQNKERAKCVEAALVLVNTTLSENTGYLSDVLKGDLISDVADKIQQALNNNNYVNPS